MQRARTNDNNVIDLTNFRRNQEADKAAKETDDEFLNEIARYLLMAANAIAARRQQHS